MNKIEEFAVAMSVLLYEMRIESDIMNTLVTPTTNNEVPASYVNLIIDDDEHAHKIRHLIKNDIINYLEQCPDDWKDDKGEYEYQTDVYDYSGHVDSYVEQLYEDTKETKDV